jgi:hypothetical protein
MTDNRFVSPDLAGTPLGTAVEVPGVLPELHSALDVSGGDSGRAAVDDQLLQMWSEATPEARSALLLNVTWNARSEEPPDSSSTAAMYVKELLNSARAQTGDADSFHGAAFPALPLPGKAGVLASGIGFDRDDLSLSLEVALLLLVALRRSEIRVPE